MPACWAWPGLPPPRRLENPEPVGRHGPMPVEPPALPLEFPLIPGDTTVSLPPGPTPTLLPPRLQQHSTELSSPSAAASLWNALSPCPSTHLPLANPRPLNLEASHGFSLEAFHDSCPQPKAWTGACRTAHDAPCSLASPAKP